MTARTLDPVSTPHVAAALAYLAGPFSGVLVLLAERTNSFVRFHAWQSVLGLGGLGVIVVLLLGLAFASRDRVGDRVPRTAAACWICWACGWSCWAMCLVKAFTRRRWKLPIAGAYAERLSGALMY